VRTTGNRAVYSGLQCMLSKDHSCCLCNGCRVDVTRIEMGACGVIVDEEIAS
jgi:hypothetical protein